jgi:hypothetical protein
MRLIMGMIIGFLLTVGVAYISDATAPATTDARQMVNWDVVAKRVEAVTAMVRDGWRRIAG